MGARVPVVQQYNLRSAADSYIGGSSLHDLNSTVVDGCPGEMDGLGEVDRDAVTEEEEDDGLDNVEESSAVVSLLVFLSEFPLLRLVLFLLKTSEFLLFVVGFCLLVQGCKRIELLASSARLI